MKLLRILSLSALVIWLILPLVPLAIWSFAHGWRYPDLLPQHWTLAAWSFAASPASGVLDSLGRSVAISVAVTALAAVIGLPAGRALGLYQFRGKALVQVIILAPTIVPGIAVVLGIHTLFIAMGLTGTVTGVVLVHLVPTLPYMVLVMASTFAAYDTAYEDQARSLGATTWQTLLHVTLPAIAPGLFVGCLFAFLVSWSQYILTLVIGGGRVITLPLLLFNFTTSGRNDITAAIALLYMVPGALFLAGTARHLTGQNPAAGLGRL